MSLRKKILSPSLISLLLIPNTSQLNDIIIYASSIQQHEQKINKNFRKIKESVNLKLQLNKCEFLGKKVVAEAGESFSPLPAH